ncbi:copper transporter [Nocardia terpenica]|uniref:copper transporter n=1 Tax=Nocardia terpenica TaxID=455432 RepID=UPI0018943709|nr:copper transporter [Nocardia terpenica]MBF6065757.1 copper transporter [Nocardia terpenica]MBF6108205.1 copper transporter [Nocardia terpenica]MBF6115872.1 copper transporter [Nocardia terpenica]MBF6123002.1 copper transporter [Nocardia terpenica]MBF6155925.1 copper transporter [Nocardia terpenica]
MISLRQHAVSIAAIFFALALGLLLGAQGLSGGVLASLRSDHGALQQRNNALAAENTRLTEEVAAADGFVARSAPRLLGGTLANRSVLLFTTPDADPGDVDAVAKALGAAGATVTGKIALTDSFVDSAQGDRLRTAVTNMIPAGAQLQTGAVDQGSLAGDLLGLAFLTDPGSNQQRATPQERGLILDTLRNGGFVATGEVQPAQLAVVLTGAGAKSEQNNQGSIIARFAGGLRGRGAGVVLAGRGGAADGAGPIAVVRADGHLASTVTTVDNVDREIGRLTTVLGLGEQLGGKTGGYGTGAKATALSVAAMPG